LMSGHEQTASLLEQLEQYMPVGFSVGYKPEEEEMLATDGEGDEKTRHIYAVDLWETSPVGIPDNPAAIAMAGAVATELDCADIDVGPELASTVATSVREGLETAHMSDSTADDGTDPEGETDDPEGTDGADTPTDTDPDDEATEPPAARFTDSEVEEIMGIVGGALEGGLNEALDEIETELQNTGGDDNGEEEEESAGVGVDVDLDGRDGADGGGNGDDPGDGDGGSGAGSDPDVVAKLEARLDALEERNEELEERLDEKEATIERLESETRESAGRKGISPPAGTDGAEDIDDGSEGSDEASTTDRSTDTLAEARRLGGN